MFDSSRFNGFVKNKLPDKLLSDIWDYFIFNERDLHSSAYYYIRQYFFRRDTASSDDVFVRCEPTMEDGRKPD